MEQAIAPSMVEDHDARAERVSGRIYLLIDREETNEAQRALETYFKRSDLIIASQLGLVNEKVRVERDRRIKNRRGTCAPWSTEGRTLEEVHAMAVDAIRAYCASLLKHGEPIPIESTEEQFIGRLRVALKPA